ncbi:MAG: nucleotidyl transferase AbiEii/AbiGii toxin family protein [Treponema sp.]|nr:nucleotidyl transferase AbiEii/AbiGii toxin family protein [Spirochaetia bacterium]MDD7459735.1 nucleotidyl transferase AbiEii/AbiGii toxin family protein [Spirochaetales bacterium]MDY5811474.1 nucleotidyl transferase AbiEii/AbiGii toxin family protein [Treponema sp.]
MPLTSAQVKGKIKNIAKTNNADARTLLRLYMMERFLERVAVSDYSDNFIIKGGILVTSMIGVSMRSTMDIDTSVRNINLSKEDFLHVIKEVSEIDLQDGVILKVKNVTEIMDEMEYPGIRIAIDSFMDGLVTPIKIDISTGDAITPEAIEYEYKLMLEERSIKLWSYNLETILAEKIQTILARGILNTRMRDFYDVYTLAFRYEHNINLKVLRQAFEATCSNRNTINLLSEGNKIIDVIKNDSEINNLWISYQKKFDYAREIKFEDALTSVTRIYSMML